MFNVSSLYFVVYDLCRNTVYCYCCFYLIIKSLSVLQQNYNYDFAEMERADLKVLKSETFFLVLKRVFPKETFLEKFYYEFKVRGSGQFCDSIAKRENYLLGNFLNPSSTSVSD